MRNSPSARTTPSVSPRYCHCRSTRRERTSGVDVSCARSHRGLRVGTFELSAAYTEVLTHTIQLFAQDPVDDELKDWYNYVIPRDKATYAGTSLIDRLDGLDSRRPHRRPAEYAGTAGWRHPVYNSRSAISSASRDSAASPSTICSTPSRSAIRPGPAIPITRPAGSDAIGRQFFLQGSYRFGGKN